MKKVNTIAGLKVLLAGLKDDRKIVFASEPFDSVSVEDSTYHFAGFNYDLANVKDDRVLILYPTKTMGYLKDNDFKA